MSYAVLHSGCNPSDHSVILAKFAIDFKRTLYNILCAHIMCTYYVHILWLAYRKVAYGLRLRKYKRPTSDTIPI